VFAGALIRIQMLVLVLPPLLAAAIFLIHRIEVRSAIIGGGTLAVMVAAAYGFDRLYVRAHPAWNAYYHYNEVAASIQDSHRLENMHLEIRHISWSDNDQEMFARYFFPDEGVFSFDRLRYLQSNVAGIGENPLFSAKALLARLGTLKSAGFLLAGLAAVLAAFSHRDLRNARWPIVCIVLASVLENWGLVWIYKNPDYVLYSSLANAGVLSTLMVVWLVPKAGERTPSPFSAAAAKGARASLAVMAVAAAALLAQAARTSIDNSRKREGYAVILADLQRLQQRGQLAGGALILSPAHGLPWDWSNPLLLGFPNVPYLDTGWITFSPSYEEALNAQGVSSLPRGLVERQNLYLVTKSAFQQYLERYYEEHEGYRVSFETIYRLPNPYHFNGYEDVQLYRVIREP
jgi:hypothetical protein